MRHQALRTGDLPALQDVLSAHRITLGGGFVVVYGKDLHVLASFRRRRRQSPASLLPWLDEGDARGSGHALHGPLSAALLSAAQRNDEPVMKMAGQEYALGMAPTASGKVVVVALPMPQGLSQTVDAHSLRRG